MSIPIVGEAQITPEWLNKVLRRSGVLGDVRVTAVECSPGAESAMWRLVHLTPHYASDALEAPRRLLVKLPLKPPGHNPAFHILGRSHEVYFYSHIAPAPAMASVPIIRCYHAVHAPSAFETPEQADAHVLVDDLSHSHWQPEFPLPPFEPLCFEAIACVASLHAAWCRHERIGAGGDITEHLVWRSQTARAYGVGNTRGVAETPIPGFLTFLGDRLSPARRWVYERLLAFEPTLLAQQAQAPQTLLHGDPHWWNFLYPHNQTTDTTRILDWGSWRIGVATNDLAYMLALQWYPERRRRLERLLLEHYHQRLIASGVTGYDWNALWSDYRLSVLWGLIKVAQCWAEGWPTVIWWDHLERAMLASEDLGCADLLET